VLVAVNGKPFVLLPALDGANFALEIRSDLAPGIKLFSREG
jgi:hypothetical protein